MTGLAACLLGLLQAAGADQAPATPAAPAPAWLHYPGDAGQAPGHGRRVVLIAGDEEYRSEEVMPMLGASLNRLGFTCFVLFSQDPVTGEVDPNRVDHMPGTHLVREAELLVVQLRFRELPDEQMAPLVEYIASGRPVIGIRTATHAFFARQRPGSQYAHWSWRDPDWPGGFGRQVLGETWVTHHGAHGSEATRGLPHPPEAHHPVLRGVGPCFGPSDVYTVRALPDDATVLLEGQVVAGMSPDDPPVDGAKNEPRLPVAWVRERVRPPEGWAGLGTGAPQSSADAERRRLPRVQRVFTTTMGTAEDWSDVDLRRLFLNASLWCLGEESAIPREGFPAALPGAWQPTPFGFDRARTGYRPVDYRDGSPWAADGAKAGNAAEQPREASR